MTGCRAPMLLVPVSFRLVLLSFLVAGGCVPMAGVVILPGGWWMCPHGWCRYPSGWCCCSSWWLVDVSPCLVVPTGILARIFTAGHPGGYARHSSARRALAVEIQVSKE